MRDGVLGIYCNKERRWSVKETGICQNVDGKLSKKYLRYIFTEMVFLALKTHFVVDGKVWITNSDCDQYYVPIQNTHLEWEE